MEYGMLKSDNLLDVLSVPQLYMMELWIETLYLDKIKLDESSVISKSGTNKTGKSAEGDSDSETEDFRRKERPSIGSEDFLLPNGLKPLRIRFTLFDLKEIIIYHVEFCTLKLIESCTETNSESGEMYNTKSDEFGNDQLDTAKTNESRKKFAKTKRFGKIQKSDADSGSKSKSKKGDKSGNTDQSGVDDELLQEMEGSLQYLFHLDELIELIDEDTFIPKSEDNFRRGASATFAMAPFDVIRSLQRGKLTLIIDRFGGKASDEGEPQGEASIILPQIWIESVLQVANDPSLAPVQFKIVDSIPVQDSSGVEIGKMAFKLKFACLSGCQISGTMPSQLGLYISLVDSNNEKSCHKSIIRKYIDVQSMMKKSMNDNYETLFKPSCTKSLRPQY